MIWHLAGLTRAKKMPKLKELLLGKSTKRGVDEAEIMDHLKAYQKRYNECQQ